MTHIRTKSNALFLIITVLATILGIYSNMANAATTNASVIPTATGVSAMWEPKIGFLVNWNAYSGSSKLVSYTVTASNGATCTTTSTQCIYSNSTVPFPFKPLTPYTFTVVANTAAGASAPSAPSPSTSWLSMAGYPAALATKQISNTEIDIAWVPSLNTGGVPIYGYKVYAWPYYNPTLQTSQLVTGIFAKFTGLTPSTWYEFVVGECNVYGCDNSDPVDQWTTPWTTPLGKTTPPMIISGGNASTTCFSGFLSGETAANGTTTFTPNPSTCPPAVFPPVSSYPVVNPSATTFPVSAPVNRFTNLSSLMLWQASPQSLAVWAKWNELMPIAPYFNNYGLLNAASSVTFTSKTPAVCGISGSNIVLISPGTCTLTAQTGGDTWYLPSAVTTGSFTITK